VGAGEIPRGIGSFRSYEGGYEFHIMSGGVAQGRQVACSDTGTPGTGGERGQSPRGIEARDAGQVVGTAARTLGCLPEGTGQRGLNCKGHEPLGSGQRLARDRDGAFAAFVPEDPVVSDSEWRDG